MLKIATIVLIFNIVTNLLEPISKIGAMVFRVSFERKPFSLTQKYSIAVLQGRMGGFIALACAGRQNWPEERVVYFKDEF